MDSSVHSSTLSLFVFGRTFYHSLVCCCIQHLPSLLKILGPPQSFHNPVRHLTAPSRLRTAPAMASNDDFHARRSVTSSRRPSITASVADTMPPTPSGAQTPGGGRLSRPLTLKIDEDSRYRAVCSHSLVFVDPSLTHIRLLSTFMPRHALCDG